VRALSAEFMKIPAPIIAPLEIMAASNNPSLRVVATGPMNTLSGGENQRKKAPTPPQKNLLVRASYSY
jgi:hypothetical protein